jgi:hypothetical protein
MDTSTLLMTYFSITWPIIFAFLFYHILKWIDVNIDRGRKIKDLEERVRKMELK